MASSRIAPSHRTASMAQKWSRPTLAAEDLTTTRSHEAASVRRRQDSEKSDGHATMSHSAGIDAEAHRIRLCGTAGDWFWFDAGRLSLEFVNTGAEEWRSFPEASDFARWAATSRLGSVTKIEADEIVVDAQEVAAVQDLQFHLNEAFHRFVEGEQLQPRSAREINAAARRSRPSLQLIDSKLHWLVPLSGAHILAEIAVDATLILSGRADGALRGCQGVGCSLLFFDNSMGQQRRWCAMERCGNRAKQRRWRGAAISG